MRTHYNLEEDIGTMSLEVLAELLRLAYDKGYSDDIYANMAYEFKTKKQLIEWLC